MLRKIMLTTTLCMSSLALTGCSSIWSAVGDLSYDMAEVTKFSWLRGPAKTDDVSFAETSVPAADGVYKTEVGEYVPAKVEIYTDNYVPQDSYVAQDSYVTTESVSVDTSQHPCPEGTYLTADNTCMSLETDTYEFADDLTTDTQQFVDTSPVPCPEGTFLNAENACMYLETEEYDFGDEVNTVEQFIDTSPVPCPEGTYLNAKNQCMYLETETLDFAAQATSFDTVTTNTTAEFGTYPTYDFAANTPTDCPTGFALKADNSCMFIGNGTDTGN